MQMITFARIDIEMEHAYRWSLINWFDHHRYPNYADNETEKDTVQETTLSSSHLIIMFTLLSFVHHNLPLFMLSRTSCAPRSPDLTAPSI